MDKEITNRVGGCFCVVVHTTGFAEVKKFDENNNKKVYDKAREYIGCKFLDHVVVERFAPTVPDLQLVFLVNDNGYIEWNNEPKQVNEVATYLYNKGRKSDRQHYILGDVVLCWLVDTPDGGEFVGMTGVAAARFCRSLNKKILPKVKKILEWDNPDPKEQEIAVRSAEKVGDDFWSFNLPLQFHRDEETKKFLGVLNYIPRKNECCELSEKDLFGETYSEQDVKDVCDTSIAILKNLIKQIERFRDGKQDMVYYPNCKDFSVSNAEEQA